MGKTSLSTKVVHFIIMALLIMYAISIIYPLCWMAMSGFKSNREIMLNTWALPSKWLWDNYELAWEYGVKQYFLNSVIVTIASVVLTIAISAIAAFALSRFEFSYKELVLAIIIGGLMLSPQVGLISLYKLLSSLRIYNTYWALIISYTAYRIPFTVFLMRSYFITLPREVEESAFIDGCNSWQVFSKIVLPMSRPIIATSALLTAMFTWNEFMFALVFIEDNSLRTVPVGLMNLRGALTTKWSVLLAGLTLSALPMIIMFLIFQKQLIRGLTSGSVKG
ncbi:MULTISPECIES: carbohydrate ABC transporter permease [Tepidanaerobacter]|uniref:Raffinose/stachyose/melibiose transport system permease protein n=3 Tax=Tepidanaerobacter syntrophicus TaxID=224999 RepID=A0A0U9HFR0_9FIRM|nr:MULTISPECIES: carbohydrate ABC transporter permease [Tepidanaerobacter]GAQ24971.1 raffinose/stachyose/melibiose transport system permease protein [Tepidanaerobacter syntrophicus]GLI19737.1 putative ABC transporter permease protein YurM [Tepidanaerobacter syntrophicus]GLI51417.1 putative ABC transporter permease protein YurM [Tepidanaerobacter syntrophicus]